MEHSPSFLEAARVLSYVFGPGAATLIVVAFINARKAANTVKPVPPPAVAIETPWLIQNILEIKLEQEGIRRGQDTLTKAVMDMAVQVNTIGALLRRSDRLD